MEYRLLANADRACEAATKRDIGLPIIRISPPSGTLTATESYFPQT